MNTKKSNLKLIHIMRQALAYNTLLELCDKKTTFQKMLEDPSIVENTARIFGFTDAAVVEKMRECVAEYDAAGAAGVVYADHIDNLKS